MAVTGGGVTNWNHPVCMVWMCRWHPTVGTQRDGRAWLGTAGVVGRMSRVWAGQSVFWGLQPQSTRLRAGSPGEMLCPGLCPWALRCPARRMLLAAPWHHLAAHRFNDLTLPSSWMFWGEDGAQQPSLCALQTSSAHGRGFALAVQWSSPTHGQAAGDFGVFPRSLIGSALQGAPEMCPPACDKHAVHGGQAHCKQPTETSYQGLPLPLLHSCAALHGSCFLPLAQQLPWQLIQAEMLRLEGPGKATQPSPAPPTSGQAPLRPIFRGEKGHSPPPGPCVTCRV